MSNDVSREGAQLIETWQRAVKDLADAKQAEIRASCALSNAKNALGKWLTPHDAKVGEVFCVWQGDSLIAAENKGNYDYNITVRTRGRHGL